MNVIVITAVTVTAVAEAAFLIRFARMPWWRTPEGRMVAARDTVISLVLVLAIIGNVWPDMPGREPVRAVLWSLIAAVFTWNTALFYRRQSEGRRLRKGTR